MHPLQYHLVAFDWSVKVSPFDFVSAVWTWLVKYGRSFIDTPEERAQIEAVAMKFYDEVLVSRFPAFAQWRLMVQTAIQVILLQLSAPPQGDVT